MKTTNLAPDADQLGFDFCPDKSRAGFRLHRVEISNWGTFDGGPHIFTPAGATAIVCGENGAGKSTLSDVLLTLLVDKGTRHFNSAGGGARTERDLRSYVNGRYADRSEDDPGLLRPPGTGISVLLAVFRNEELGTVVSLAQILWDSRGEGPIDPLHIVCDRELDTLTHLQFDAIAGIRDWLRERSIPFTTSFEEYRQGFFKKLWLPEDREGRRPTAMFNRAVGMKDIPDINEFIRRYVLETGDIQARHESLAKEFKDLRHTHELILLDESRQKDLEAIEAAHAETGEAEAARIATSQSLALYPLASHRARLTMLAHVIGIKAATVAADREKLAGLRRREAELKEEVNRLAAAIGTNDTQRALEDFSRLIRELDFEIPKCRDRDARFREKLAALGDGEIQDASAHAAYFAALPARIETLRITRARIAESRDSKLSTKVDAERELAGLESDLATLRASKSNIPPEHDRRRRDLAAHLGVPAASLRFAGEWLRLKPGERLPESALNRLLRPLALTLIVPPSLREKSDAWLDSTALGCDFALMADEEPADAPPAAGTIAAALDAHPESGDTGARLLREIARRFPHRPVDSPKDGRSGAAWFTPAGTRCDTGHRREKADGIALGSPATLVLGWDNSAKLAELAQAADTVRTRLADCRREIRSTEAEMDSLDRQLTAAQQLPEHFADYASLDWRALQIRKTELERQKHTLEKSATALRDLREQKESAESRHRDTIQSIGSEGTKLTQAEDRLAQHQHQLATTRAAEAEEARKWDGVETEGLERRLTAYDPENWANLDRNVEIELKGACRETLHRYEKCVAHLRSLVRTFVAKPENADKKDTVYSEDWEKPGYNEALYAPFAELLASIRRDNLPKNRQSFAEKMRRDMTIHCSEFSQRIAQLVKRIPETITALNGPLGEIIFDRATGSRIRLKATPSNESEIKTFRAMLEETLLNAIHTERTESELLGQFHAIERLLKKLESDTKWAEIVLDVRQRYVFEAEQCFPEDPARLPIPMRGARGKSGGEKNRLATTLLAAGIAHQYGLTSTRPQAESFRLVVVDEMFAKTDDAFSRYLLNLFKVFHLQLIIIHPLDAKLHIVKPFVEHYAVVSKRNQRSTLRTLTVAEVTERLK